MPRAVNRVDLAVSSARYWMSAGLRRPGGLSKARAQCRTALARSILSWSTAQARATHTSELNHVVSAALRSVLAGVRAGCQSLKLCTGWSQSGAPGLRACSGTLGAQVQAHRLRRPYWVHWMGTLHVCALSSARACAGPYLRATSSLRCFIKPWAAYREKHRSSAVSGSTS